MLRWILAVPFLGLAFGAGCSDPGGGKFGAEDREAFQRLLLQHAQLYPEARVEDFYKLIHQSAFGVAHLIEDKASAREYLDRETRSLGPPLPGEPLLEPLDPAGRLVRVNLRPFAAQGLSPDSLVAVLIETSRSVLPDSTLFLVRWSAFRDLLRDGRIRLPMEDFQAVDARAREEHWPAIHHSEAYSRAYRPAYRVVRRDLFLERVPGPYRPS
jgi:hypothetical protein